MLQIRRAPIAVTARLMLLSILVLTFLAGSLAGQVTTATLYGTTIDPSGAAIPGAIISVTNEGTQSVSKATTDAKGEFTVTFLPVGSYTVSAKAANFREERRPNLALGASQRVLLTFTLQVGATADSVTVTEGAP